MAETSHSALVRQVIREHGIPDGAEVSLERQSRQRDHDTTDVGARVDLRNLPWVTMDDVTARDLDDALCCQARTAGGWELWVAIADVAHYVAPGSAVDREAQKRGNSVYFPDSVVRMLPKSLSDDLCSLNPGTDKLCLACVLEIAPDGELLSFRFFEAVVYSCARLDYATVSTFYETGDPSDIPPEAVPMLRDLGELHQALEASRDRRGGLVLELPTPRLALDADGAVTAVTADRRNVAQRIVEQCMLCANVAAAKLLRHHRLDGLYRNHLGPDGEARIELRRLLAGLGLSLPGVGDEQIATADLQRVMDRVSGRESAMAIHMATLRWVGRASYSPVSLGHFGLNYEDYTHFTSPIRRYPDLLVCRALRVVIRQHGREGVSSAARGSAVLSPSPDGDSLEAMGHHCSETERRADDAGREVMQRLIVEFLENHVGREFGGIITAVMPFGLFVHLSDFVIDGLLSVRDLPGDYYVHNERLHSLVGRRTGRCFRLGESIRVRLAEVDVQQGRLRLVPAGGSTRSRRSPRRRDGRRSR